jgi:hypothetical protein
MGKLQLPSVTLMCIDCVDVQRAISVIEICKNKVDFGDVKLLTSSLVSYQHRVEIMPLNSLVAYSVFMLTKSHEYIDTDHVLIVQRDGWILNPQSFNMEWLQLDWISPLFMQYSKVGSGGFSLRSKKIMQDISKTVPQWDGTQENADEIQKQLSYYEDGVICLSAFAKNYKIATPEQAADFAQGGCRDANYFRKRPFGFHRTWQVIDFKTGEVDSSDLSKDINANYNEQIQSIS